MRSPSSCPGCPVSCRNVRSGWAGRPCGRCPRRPRSLADGRRGRRAFTEIGAIAGKGSQARRSELLRGLFAAATEVEQTFLRRLLGGELRQGALVGVMADAVAKAQPASRPADGAAGRDARRRPARGRRGRAAPAAQAALDRVHACRSAGRSGRCWRRPPPASADALERLGGEAVFEAKLDGARVQIHRAGDDVSIYTRSLDDVTARLPEVVEATLALPGHDADRRRRGDRAAPRRPPAPVPGHRVAVRPLRRRRRRARPTQPLSVFFFDVLHVDGVDLLDAPATRARRGAGRDRAGESAGRPADHLRCRRGPAVPRRDAGRRARRA